MSIRKAASSGIVTVDDVIDVIGTEATEDFELRPPMTPSDKPYSMNKRVGYVEAKSTVAHVPHAFGNVHEHDNQFL